jgi:hypothetical protein
VYGSDLEMVRLPTISALVPLYELLDIFQTGKCMSLLAPPLPHWHWLASLTDA